MEWTPELDATLTELHGKRLGTMFIASWMRLRPSDVRHRLATLGLRKPPSVRVGGRAGMRPPTPGAAPAVARPATAAPRAAAELDEDDDDSDMVRIEGRPRGYLMSDARINELFRRAGRGY
jgi:hypothetical protein